MEMTNNQTQRGIICSANYDEHDGKFCVTIYISDEQSEAPTTATAEVDYREWAIMQDVPVCEPLRDFYAFCNSCFDTDEKKQAFIDRNLENPSGDDELEHDYYEAVVSVWNEHYRSGIERSKDYFWDTFVEESTNEIADRLISQAEDKGLIITKSDFIACSDLVPCFKNLTVDTPPLTVQKSEGDLAKTKNHSVLEETKALKNPTPQKQPDVERD